MAEEPQILLHGDLHHFNILLDYKRGWTAIDPSCEIGPSCLEFGSFVGNAGEEEASKEEERATIVEAIEMLSETSRESLERVYAGTFFDYVVWTSRRLKDPPNDEEAGRTGNLSRNRRRHRPGEIGASASLTSTYEHSRAQPDCP